MAEQEEQRIEEAGEGLRQALLRLTDPRYAALRADLETLRQEIEARSSSLDRELNRFQEELAQGDQDLRARLGELQKLLQETRLSQAGLEERLSQLKAKLGGDIAAQDLKVQAEISDLENRLVDRQSVTQRVTPVLIPMISESATREREAFAEAVAPVIGPAIRHQIRESRQDIIDSLYPLIGQIIGKAVSEAFRELMRNIDARLRQQLNFRDQFKRLTARLRGVSEAELLLRESLPYSIQHIFLIHRQTGLLLTHVHVSGEKAEEMDILSGMLTAIRDFVQDSFGESQGELEEITHGDQRILLESGQYAYVAVVLEGVEPPGYAHLMQQVTSQVNVQYEPQLSQFQGDMDRLPDFSSSLAPLHAAVPQSRDIGAPAGKLSRNQKLAFTAGLGGIIILLALIAFECVFTYRLWSYAFPGPTPSLTPSPSSLPAILPSPLPPPTARWTVTPSPTPSATLTVSPSPQNTQTANPTAIVYTLTGDLNVRSAPGAGSRILGSILAGEKVLVLEKQGDWITIRWPVQGQPKLEGWIWIRWTAPTP